LRAAPPDLVALSFLNDAPPPRAFWARRQAHETAIHMVDALATARSDDLGIDGALAVDGVAELLAGVLPARGARVRWTWRSAGGFLRPRDVQAVRRRAVHDPGDGDRRRALLAAARRP